MKLTQDSPYLVAKIGWNFLGNLKLAKTMIFKAKQSGALAVKFQIWNPEFLKKGAWDLDGRRKIYEKAYLDIKKYNFLKNFCKRIKIECFASVFAKKDAQLLYKNKDKVIKIPSHEAYNIELINYSLKKFDLVLVSVGALKKQELKKLLRYRNNKKFVPLHCVSSYPLDSKNCNFKKFDFLKKNYKNVGYSGHYGGCEDGILAASRGACIIEKHFTTSKSLPGRDNKFALLPKEFNKISNWIKLLRDFNLDSGLGLQKCESDIFKNYRGRWNATK